MESNTAKCALQLLIQKAFRHPSIAEQLSTFINSRNVFIKIHGSALLKHHKSHLHRPPLFIFPGCYLKEVYFQHIIQTSSQACLKHCRRYTLQNRVFLFCLTSWWRAVLRTPGPKSKKQKWSALTITGTPTPRSECHGSESWPQHGRGPSGFSTDTTPTCFSESCVFLMPHKMRQMPLQLYLLSALCDPHAGLQVEEHSASPAPALQPRGDPSWPKLTPAEAARLLSQREKEQRRQSLSQWQHFHVPCVWSSCQSGGGMSYSIHPHSYSEHWNAFLGNKQLQGTQAVKKIGFITHSGSDSVLLNSCSSLWH